MMRARLLLSGMLTLVAASCQGPLLQSGGGRGHSEYGDRPGPQGFRTVVIDAGHGGVDSGARGRITGVPEKTIALDIAQRLRSALSPSFRTVMTRTTDTKIPLDTRVDIANRSGDAVLVSIHLNEGPSRLNGIETYWWRVDSASLARRVHTNLNAVVPGSNNRGLVRRRLRLTRNPEIPCLLVECGYLSNTREANALTEAAYRTRIAQAIARAIREQSALGDAGYGALPKPIYAKPSSAHDARE